MGLIFDEHAYELYRAWCRSPTGRAAERSAEILLRSLLAPKPGERVLDIGCGAGDHLLFLGKLGLDLTGLDASPHMIDRAKERLGRRCALRLGRAEDLPFEDNEFDLAVLFNTLEFLEDPLPALREAGRVARRRVFIGAMNSLSWHFLSSRLQMPFRTSILDQVRFYNLWELKSRVRVALGPAPLAWGCVRRRSPVPGGTGPLTDAWRIKRHPFGPILGLAATIVYTTRTDNLPLKVRLRKAGDSLPSGATVGDLRCLKAGGDDERGLPVRET